ncbi:MAG TPA: NUDIX domain-containing protein, partial [Solirubrobacteraceae bacterium]|nr:NUDIX domain-containing protein [Solirubrobacteraceae bacterium]
RILYRVAWRGVQLRAQVWPRRGTGVKFLLTNGGEVLLVRHTYGKRDTWYIPGGAARRGEPPLQAAARELAEELGVRGLPLRELASVDMRLEQIEVRLTCAYAELPDRALVRVDPVEIAQARWFAPDALPTPRGVEVEQLLALLRGEAT